MSSLIHPTGRLQSDHSPAIARALHANASRLEFIQPISSVSYHTNWSISHLLGPSIFQTSSHSVVISTSSLLPSTTTTTAAAAASIDAEYYPFWLLVTVAVFGSVTSVLTVLGNILVILAFFLDRQIRQPTNYFILSLSVSDFLIGLLSMPLLTIYIYARDWPLNAIICDIWLSLDYTVCLTSIYTVLFITIDRFCSVKMPAKYRKWRTGKKINIMITITWAVPCLIFFTATMIYPRVKGISNLQHGVCDVQWNKNRVFNLCLTIGYFWTTLVVMIVLYIFIYDVASNLERKSRENARKMSSLVGNAMTHIGVGIGVSKSPTKPPAKKPHHSALKKLDSNTCDDFEEEDPQNLLAHSAINTQNSSNSSEQRRCPPGDDDNSNSFESHSDFDFNKPPEKKTSATTMGPNSSEKPLREKSRRVMSVNWGSGATNPLSVSTVATHLSRRQPTPKSASNVKFFATSMAHSLYKAPIRLSGFSSSSKAKGSGAATNRNSPQRTSGPQQAMSAPSELDVPASRAPSRPQPRPESLAIMSEELFHQRLKARQSPLLTAHRSESPLPLNVNQQVATELPSTSAFLGDELATPAVTSANPADGDCQQGTPTMHAAPTDELNSTGDSQCWRNSSGTIDEHIPYIDETDFEDLGYILHRRRVPPADSNEPIQEETIIYKSPFYIKHKPRSETTMLSPEAAVHDQHRVDRKIYEIYGNHQDAHKVILESPIYDSVELITYACPNGEASPIRHCSLRNVPAEALLKSIAKPVPTSTSSNATNNGHTTSSIIFVSKAKAAISPSTSSSLSQAPAQSVKSSSSIQNADVERALIDFYQCSQINELDGDLLNDNDSNASDDLEISLSNYNEGCEEASSLLRLNEQHSSAFIDDESSMDDVSIRTKQSHSSRYSHPPANQNSHFMKMMILNKARQNVHMDTTSDERTTTNSFSLNTYSQDFSVDKIFQYDSSTPPYRQQPSQNSWCSSSSTTTSSSYQNPQIPLLLLRSSSPQNFLSATEKKRNASSDSDAITTTTSLTNSTQYGGRDSYNNGNREKSRDSISQEVLRAFNKTNATTITDDLEQEPPEPHHQTLDRAMKPFALPESIVRDDDPLSTGNRGSSKVTFESVVTTNAVPPSPKTKDQSVMAQIDVKGRLNYSNSDNALSPEQVRDPGDTKNELTLPISSEGTTTAVGAPSKSSIKELARNQKSVSHRKSKTQNRARKALRTITFILGAFVVCWTPWHIYSAIHSLCDSCKNSWIFANPMFHCFYFLCYLNSPINPFCYALANQQFKKTFTRILKLDLRRL